MRGEGREREKERASEIERSSSWHPGGPRDDRPRALMRGQRRERRRHGGDEDHLPHRRRGDAVSGEAEHIAGARDPRRLQECPQSAQLQVLLQVDGR